MAAGLAWQLGRVPVQLLVLAALEVRRGR